MTDDSRMPKKERTPQDIARGVWLRARREELGLTQMELAWRLKIHAAVLSKIENGYMEPGIDRWSAILKALDYETPWYGELASGDSDTGSSSHFPCSAQSPFDQEEYMATG